MEGRLRDRGQRADQGAHGSGSSSPLTRPRLIERARRRAWPVPFGALALLAPVIVFWDDLIGHRLIAPGEAFAYNLPLHTLVGRMWRHGLLPAWNTWSFSGSPLLATGQPGAFYPINALFVVAPPVVANNLAVIAGFMLTALGGYLLGRHLTGDPAAGAVTGLAFAFCAFFFAHLPHQAVLDSATWLPWLIYGFERLRERVTPGRVVVGGGALALMILAGHFQTAAIGLALLGLCRRGGGHRRACQSHPVAHPDRSGPGSGCGFRLVGGAVVGHRQHHWFHRPGPRSLRGSHQLLVAAPPSFIGFPYLFGGGPFMAPYTTAYHGQWNLAELSGYPGMAAAVLAAVGLVAGRRDRRVWAFVLVGVVGVYASLGGSTQFGRVIYHLPPYGQFRSWARFIVILDLVVAVLAGYGVAALRRRASARLLDPQLTRAASGPSHPTVRTAGRAAVLDTSQEIAPNPPRQPPASGRLLVFVAVGAAALVAVAAGVATSLPHVRLYLPRPGPPILARLLPALAAAAAAAVAALMLRRPRLAGYLCCALVLLDAVATFGWSSVWRSNSVPPPAAAATAVQQGGGPNFGRLHDAPGGIDRYVIASPDFGSITNPQVNAPMEVRSVNGFDPLAPVDYLVATGYQQYFGGIMQPEDYWRPGSDLPDLLRVTTVLVSSSPAVPKPPPTSPLGRPKAVARSQADRYERQPALPDAILVGAAQFRQRPQTLHAVQGLTPFDPRQKVLFDSGCDGCPGPGARPGPAGTATRQSGSNSMTIDVRADRNAVLVVSEAWFPGWYATVDGRSAHVARLDAVVMGVGVPAGHHTVRFHYRPPGVRLGLLVTVATALTIVAWWVIDQARRRRWRAPTGRRKTQVATDA